MVPSRVRACLTFSMATVSAIPGNGVLKNGYTYSQLTVLIQCIYKSATNLYDHGYDLRIIYSCVLSEYVAPLKKACYKTD